MIFSAVFLLSLSSLAFEVLLTRVFSISQWNHLSFMVLSVALFGFAASGTVLSILNTQITGWEKRLPANRSIHTLIFLYIGSTIGSFLTVNNIPLDYFRLPLEPIQICYLFITYLSLTLPFFFTGMMVSIAFVCLPEKTGYVYFATMAGSACGAILPLPSLPFWGEGKLILVSAFIPAVLPAFDFARQLMPWRRQSPPPDKNQRTGVIVGFGITIAATILVIIGGERIIEVRPSDYKALSQLMQFPKTHISASTYNIRGRIERVKSPYIRFASGLSLKHTSPLPKQDAIFRDGDNQFVLYEITHPNDLTFSKSTLTYAGYSLIDAPQHILLIQNGGGLGILCLMASLAHDLTIVEQNPQVARTVNAHYMLPVKNSNPRAFLASSDQLFDVIQIENWGTSILGSAALTQDYSFTIEAFIEYFEHLSERGILIISRKLLLPPADSVRLWCTALEGLKSLKYNNPEQHIALLRNWDTFTLIVSMRPLNDASSLIEFAEKKNFDLVYLPSLELSMANRFSIFDIPYHFSKISDLAQAYRSEKEFDFFKSYLLDVTPQTDKRPFPARFLKWSRLGELYESTGGRIYSLLMSGEIVILVVFVEAFVISLFLLSLPFLIIKKRGNKPFLMEIAYFLSIGAGFMLVELYFIKQFILLFGDPVISFTVVLTGILVYSGIGGIWSQRISPKGIKKVLICLTILLIIIFFSFEKVTYKILGLPNSLRYICAFLTLFPCGILIGLPFPLGMRYLVKSPVKRTHAWTANGCTSVLSSILAVQIALSFGISYIIAGAASAYFIAFVSTFFTDIQKI
ncbi:MAG: hypothetical protein JSU83_08690 [Deltaproteobacteria bacterium]|nr:MAG: hypothetical protein JSU83_08690 [Deltaproteobacteria bacterium]